MKRWPSSGASHPAARHFSIRDATFREHSVLQPTEVWHLPVTKEDQGRPSKALTWLAEALTEATVIGTALATHGGVPKRMKKGPLSRPRSQREGRVRSLGLSWMV